MTNKQLFDKANTETNNSLKNKLREEFGKWCASNGRTLLNPMAMQDWFKEESTL